MTSIGEVRRFWEANPLAAAANPHPLGSREYFAYYDQMRHAKESPAFSSWLHEYDRFAGKRVLDVGCGNGYVLSRYSMAGARTTGVDLTEAGVTLSRQRFQHAGLPGSFSQGNAEQLPFADESFDCVCSMGVLHHTPDTARAVAEVHRVLRPGGRLIVMFYHRNSARYRVLFPYLRWRTAKSIRQLVDEVDGVGNPKGDVYSSAELRRLLGGFEQIETFAGSLQGWHLLPIGGSRLPGRLLRMLERRLGWFLYAKAVKPKQSQTSTVAPL